MLDRDYFYYLKELSSLNLSNAHIYQHSTTANLTAKLLNLNLDGAGAHSAIKPKDTLLIENSKLSGKKHWVSNILDAKWASIHVVKCQIPVVLLVLLDHCSTFEMVPTIGMENTFTGHITFNHAPIIGMCNKESPEYFPIGVQHYMAFITNHYGLTSGLFSDIDMYTEQHNISCIYEKQKIKLNLSVLKLLWESCLIDPPKQDGQYWSKLNTVYGFAKQTLVNTTQLVTEVTGSGLFEIGTDANQRYRDALIYSSHMRNLYFSMEQNLA